MYPIQEGMKVDVGLVIQHSIVHGFEHGVQGLAYPHLITELCHNTKVKQTQNKEVRAPKGVINDAVMVKIWGEGDEAALRLAGVGNLDLGLPMIGLIIWSNTYSISLRM